MVRLITIMPMNERSALLADILTILHIPIIPGHWFPESPNMQ